MPNADRMHGNGDLWPTMLRIVDEIRKETRAIRAQTEIFEARTEALESRVKTMESRAAVFERWVIRSEDRLKDGEDERRQMAVILNHVAEVMGRLDHRVTRLERRRG